MANVFRLKVISLSVLLLLLLLPGCARTVQSVGIQYLSVPSAKNTPEFVAQIWYPTEHGTVKKYGESRIRPGYFAIPDGDYANQAPASLIVLVHGSGGSADSMAWLATEFAKRGSIVVAADHPASSGGDPERASLLNVWTQPEDIHRLLDVVINSPWGPRINQKNIAVVGFSLGGTSSILVAGGQLQLQRFPEFCNSNNDGACTAFSHHFKNFDDDFYNRANGKFLDSRISAAVAIAPGFTESLVIESVESLPTPLLLLSGGMDQQLPPSTHVYPIRDYLPEHSRYVEIENAQHFSFLPLCGDGAIEVLSETKEEFVCQEFGSKTREEIHYATFFEIANFLQSKGFDIDF
ncbi:alpha/beta hydrolase family protein [Pleionea litopenaei]|uniref:Alpha/beta fold hydrolase n=1 Tax=Pleionea litopenaei TaxID=3070815 RepID=A0AA51X8C1_9GAMM|nr:alpha/beta fold hydrolase [Pleionea sp. HL-JVS1]WMS88779.1 alpha/beta fold hydrolase [Pleionea sp. HL-JVS1]